MNWYKIELTKEQLSQKEDVKIEEQIETIRSSMKNRSYVSSFSTSSTTRPKTIYLSPDKEGLCNVVIKERPGRTYARKSMKPESKWHPSKEKKKKKKISMPPPITVPL